jgi:hypothetical protein
LNRPNPAIHGLHTFNSIDLAASPDLRARRSYELQATSYELHASYELQITSYEIRDPSYELRDTRYKITLAPGNESTI